MKIRRLVHPPIITLAILAQAPTAAGDGWVAGPSLPNAADGRRYAAGLNDDGRIYVLGGMPFDAQDDNARVDYLDPGDTWTISAPVEGPIVRQGAGVDAIGRVIMFGGRDYYDPKGDEGRAYEYDVVEGQWHDVAQRSGAAPPMHFAWATDDAGRIYSIGGGPGDSASANDPNLAHVERYDALADTWETVSPMSIAVADAAAVNDGTGRLLVIGGIDAEATSRLAVVQTYDVASDAWSTVEVPPLPVAASDHRAALGADGRVYVAGGVTGAIGAGTTVASTWVLDVASNTWSPGPELGEARSCFALALGPDDHLWAMGGCDDTGGTDGVERLYTPSCPTFAEEPPADVNRWTRQTLVLRADVIGGTPMTFRWRKDGIDLFDGPSDGGGTISGAASDTIMITDAAPPDAGAYALAATNPCGTTVSAASVVTVTTPAPTPRSWEVVNLHPSWSLSSSISAVADGVQLGAGSVEMPPHGAVSRPVIWSGTPASAVDLTPSNSAGGALLAGDADVQVGWWWWPYNCQPYTCYHRHGAMWNGTPESHDDVHQSGREYSVVSDTDGATHVGTVSWDDESGNHYARAGLFPPPNHTYRSLHPADYSNSSANAIDGEHQFGSANTPFPGPRTHAAMWTGTAESFVDLDPPNSTRSWITYAADGQQIGTAAINDVLTSGTWDGAPGTFRAFTSGSLSACGGGYQVGSSLQSGASGAAIWVGADETLVGLHAFVPSEFTSSGARSVHVADDGAITVGGYGWNGVTERSEALIWRSIAGRPGDVNGDGFVDFEDLLLLLAAWGPCEDCPEDVDGNGQVDFADLLIVLANWG